MNYSVRSFAWVLCLLALFAAVGIISATDRAQLSADDALSPAPIKIGVIQSLTGIAAEDGKTIVQALKLAADDFNAKGAARIEILVEDDGTQPKNAVSAFDKLALQGVHAIIGATSDFTANSILPLAAQRKRVVFNTSAFVESLNLKDSDGFGITNSSSALGEAEAFNTYLSKHDIKSMTILFANNPWGETQLEVYKRIAARHRVAVNGEIRSTTYDANDWGVPVLKMKQSMSDLGVLLLNKSDLALFISKARETGLRTQFFASRNMFDAVNIGELKSYFDGTCFPYPYAQLQKENDFQTRYLARFGERPKIYADSSYDALFIIAKGVELSRTQKIPLKEALPLVEYIGLVGKYRFSDQKSFALGESSLMCVRSGGTVVAEL